MHESSMEYSDDYIREILTDIKIIALVGASRKTHRASYQVMEFLLQQGYDVIPVNPAMQGEELLGQTVYGSLVDIPWRFDMVDVFRNSEAALMVTRAALPLQPKVIWMQNGVINHEAAELAKQAGVKMVMDRCPKIEIPRLGL